MPAPGGGFKAAYDLAFERLAGARLSPYPFAVGAMILKGSLGIGRLKAVIPNLNYFTLGTGIAQPHVCDALRELLDRNIIFSDPPGENQKGTKLYWINALFDAWRLKQRKLKRQPNLPLVMEQMALEYDRWVTERGPLSDSLLENFVETAGAAVETKPNLCGAPKPPVVTERPVGAGNLSDGEKKKAPVNPWALSDGSQGAPVKAVTQTSSRKHLSDEVNLAATPPTPQAKISSSPLKKSEEAWNWLVAVDSSGPVQKLSHPLCQRQWQELCLADPEYVLRWLAACWKRRSMRTPAIENPISYLSRVALGDHRLKQLKALAHDHSGGGSASFVITESVITARSEG